MYVVKKNSYFDEIYVGGSLAILLKSLCSSKKILIIEKDTFLGGAWKNCYSNILRNLDTACHLIVTQSYFKSIRIIKFFKKQFKITLIKIEKKNFFFDDKNWRLYGKRGPALIAKEGWSNLLNKIIFLIRKKKNIKIIKKTKVKKIELLDKKVFVFYGNRQVAACKKVYIPTYCDLKHIKLNKKKILFNYKKIKNIHIIYNFIGHSDRLNNNFQALWSHGLSNIFDRLSVSRIIDYRNGKKKYTICSRVAKPYKKKLFLLNAGKIKKFLIKNKLITDGKVENLKKVFFYCPYRTAEQIKSINEKLNKSNANDVIEVLSTRYMGHYLWSIIKN
jgi:hypothetical protein